MIELNDFYNDGTGWICRHCEVDPRKEQDAPQRHSRMYREGESENNTADLSNRAMASWMDKAQMVLICPRCKITEAVDKS